MILTALTLSHASRSPFEGGAPILLEGQMLLRRTLLPGNPRERFHVVSWWVAMVTEFLELACAVGRPLLHQWEDRLAHWLWQLRRLSCSWLRRHDEFLQFEKNRLSLRCISCGHGTPGWVLDRKTPLVRFPAERRRTQGPRVSERKIA